MNVIKDLVIRYRYGYIRYTSDIYNCKNTSTV